MAKGTTDNRKPTLPFFQRYDRGYQVSSPDRPQTRARTNATLLSGVNPQVDVTGSSRIDLWVTDNESDFGIAGQTAQSRMRRTFFPHNLSQTAYSITGQCPNQEEYGRLTEFVRSAQVSALTSQTLMRLIIPEAGLPGGRTMKGRRKAIDAIGYVQAMPRSHERFVNAPSYTFSFIISRSLAGLFQDEAVRVNYIKSWSEIFENPHFQAQFIDDPDLSLHDDDAPARGLNHPDPGTPNEPPRGSRPPVIHPLPNHGGKAPIVVVPGG